VAAQGHSFAPWLIVKIADYFANWNLIAKNCKN
jgi:hypothetical protein